MFDDFDEIDFDDPGAIDLFGDDEASGGKYRVYLIGVDENGKSTDYEYCYGCYETIADAEDAIDDFLYDNHFDMRDAFNIPDEVVGLEIRGEEFMDSILEENSVFYSRPFDISMYD